MAMPQTKTEAARTENPEFSVIIPFKDRQELLETLFRSLRDSGPASIGYEVLVVDDGSAQSPRALCETYGATLHPCGKSHGPAHARNLGAKHAKGSVFLFLDSDVVYARGLMETAKSILDAHEDVHAVSFINQPYDPGASAVANFASAIEHFWFLRFIPEGVSFASVPGFATRAGAVRKAAFDAIGGFDVFFRTNAIEDYDFGKRLASRFTVVLARTPCIYHHFPQALPRLMRNYFVRTSLFIPYFLKNRPPLDKAQTSRPEFLIRAAGIAAVMFGALVATPVGPRTLWIVLGALSLIAYLGGASTFLAAAFRHSRSPVFLVQCIAVHFLSTLVIAAGGAAGLASYLAGLTRRRACV